MISRHVFETNRQQVLLGNAAVLVRWFQHKYVELSAALHCPWLACSSCINATPPLGPVTSLALLHLAGHTHMGVHHQRWPGTSRTAHSSHISTTAAADLCPEWHAVAMAAAAWAAAQHTSATVHER